MLFHISASSSLIKPYTVSFLCMCDSDSWMVVSSSIPHHTYDISFLLGKFAPLPKQHSYKINPTIGWKAFLVFPTINSQAQILSHCMLHQYNIRDKFTASLYPINNSDMYLPFRIKTFLNLSCHILTQIPCNYLHISATKFHSVHFRKNK